jgi:DNA-binding beta-propeller fold protein YncE
MKQFLWLGLLLCSMAIWTGCGDTFRPVIIPNPPAFPDPRASHSVMAVNDNGTGNPGSAMVVDVSGDSDASVRDVGLAPVHAVQQTANQVLVVNHAAPGANADSLTKLIFLGTQIANTTTISLPSDSSPNFVATTESTQAYVVLPNLVPDPVNHPGVVIPSVGVVSTTSNALVATIPLSNNPLANPLAMAETPDGKKLYVAVTGDNAVSGFNTLDRSARTITNGIFNSPLWVVARSDSQRVYVLDADGTLITIDTTSTSGPDAVIPPGLPVGAGATFMIYDVRRNRIYVPSGSQVAVVDVSGSSPQVLGAPVPIPTVPPSARSAQDPCFSTSATTLQVVSVAALPDESRAYVGAFYEDASGNICPQVTVINTAGNTVKTTTPVPGVPGIAPFSPPVCASTRFRFMMAAGGDSSRVYLASCDAGNVNIIDTATDTYLLSLPAPASARAPIPPSSQPPPQNPVFLIAGP